MRRRSFIIALVLFAFIADPCRAQDSYQTEAGRLAVLLDWHSGNVVGEIGAGHGQMTLAAAKVVGPTGRVYSTELDPKLLANLESLAQTIKNITAVKAAEAETNLPERSCDSIFMRLVYHHLTKPAEIDASLFRSLKPGVGWPSLTKNRHRDLPRWKACPRTAAVMACRRRSSSRKLPQRAFSL